MCAMAHEYDLVTHRHSQFPMAHKHESKIIPRALRAAAGHSVDLEGFEPSTSSVRLRRAPTALQARSFRVMMILPVGLGAVKIEVFNTDNDTA